MTDDEIRKLLPGDLRDRFKVYMRERFPWFGVAKEPPADGSLRARQLTEATREWFVALTDDDRRRVVGVLGAQEHQ